MRLGKTNDFQLLKIIRLQNFELFKIWSRIFIMSLDLVEYAKTYETKNRSLCEWKMKYYIQITLLVLRLSCSGQKIKKKRDNLKWLIN